MPLQPTRPQITLPQDVTCSQAFHNDCSVVLLLCGPELVIRVNWCISWERALTSGRRGSHLQELHVGGLGIRPFAWEKLSHVQ